MKKILCFIAGLFCGIYRKTMVLYVLEMILLILGVFSGINKED